MAETSASDGELARGSHVTPRSLGDGPRVTETTGSFQSRGDRRQVIAASHGTPLPIRHRKHWFPPSNRATQLFTSLEKILGVADGPSDERSKSGKAAFAARSKLSELSILLIPSRARFFVLPQSAIMEIE